MYPASLQSLIESFRLLPGVGEKTAERYALLICDTDYDDVQKFAQAMLDVKTKITHCKICGNLSETDVCEICSNEKRNHRQIVVVQSARDIIAIEKTRGFNGVYHVLNGVISTSRGIMPDDLNIDDLLERAKNCDEVILATSATMDGETTAMYIDRLLKEANPNLLVTRIAHGLPSGGMLDYADEMTLTHALTGRKKMG